MASQRIGVSKVFSFDIPRATRIYSLAVSVDIKFMKYNDFLIDAQEVIISNYSVIIIACVQFFCFNFLGGFVKLAILK